MTRIQHAARRQRSGAAYLVIALLAGGTLAGTLAGGDGPGLRIRPSGNHCSGRRRSGVPAMVCRTAAGPGAGAR